MKTRWDWNSWALVIWQASTGPKTPSSGSVSSPSTACSKKHVARTWADVEKNEHSAASGASVFSAPRAACSKVCFPKKIRMYGTNVVGTNSKPTDFQGGMWHTYIYIVIKSYIYIYVIKAISLSPNRLQMASADVTSAGGSSSSPSDSCRTNATWFAFRNHIISAPAPGAWLSFVEHHMWSSAWWPVEKGKCVSEWTLQTCIWSPSVNILTSGMVAKLLYIYIHGYSIYIFTLHNYT